MELSDLNLDEIVQRVLQQMQHSVITPVEAADSSSTAVEVVVSGRVVTAEQIAEQASGAKRIRVQNGAIVTPAARDYLKHKQIELSHGPETFGRKSASNAGKQPVSTWLSLVVEPSAEYATAIKSVTKAMGVGVSNQLVTSTREAVDVSISEIQRGAAQGIFVITNRPGTAACWANRNDAVRAVSMRSLADIEEVEQLEANVICLPNRGLSVAQWLQILRALLK